MSVSPTTGLATAYEIRISEAQRVALLALIRASGLPHLCGDGAPLEYWEDILDELPAVEAANPNATHGFCL